MDVNPYESPQAAADAGNKPRGANIGAKKFVRYGVLTFIVSWGGLFLVSLAAAQDPESLFVSLFVVSATLLGMVIGLLMAIVGGIWWCVGWLAMPS